MFRLHKDKKKVGRCTVYIRILKKKHIGVVCTTVRKGTHSSGITGNQKVRHRYRKKLGIGTEKKLGIEKRNGRPIFGSAVGVF